MIFPPVYQPAPLMLAEPAAYSSSSPAHHLVDKTVGTTPTHTTVLPLAPYPLIGGGGRGVKTYNLEIVKNCRGGGAENDVVSRPSLLLQYIFEVSL